jgi:hypothetical protein
MLPTAAVQDLYRSIPDSLWSVERSDGDAWTRASNLEGTAAGLRRVTAWATRWRINAPCVRGWALRQRYYWIACNMQMWRGPWQGTPLAPPGWRPTFRGAEWPWGLLPWFADEYLPPIFRVLRPFDEWPLNANFGERVVSEDVAAACPLGCNPFEESDDEFIERARRHRAARVKALVADFRTPAYRPMELRELERHCRWLLMARLSDPPLSSTKIARNEGITRQTISSGVAALERLLLFAPFRIRSGRPPRK